MTESEQPAPRPASQLSSPPPQPAIAEALRVLGPDYEEALVNSIAERVDELARQRESRGQPVPPLPGQHPQQLPVQPHAPHPPAVHPPAPMPSPPAPGPQQRWGAGVALPVSILSLCFGFVITIVALTAGFSDGGPLALIAILIVWLALVLINFAAWSPRRPGP